MSPPSSCLSVLLQYLTSNRFSNPTHSVRDVTSQTLLKETLPHPFAVWLLPCSLCLSSHHHHCLVPMVHRQKNLKGCCSAPQCSATPSSDSLVAEKCAEASLCSFSSLSVPFLPTDNIKIVICSTSQRARGWPLHLRHQNPVQASGYPVWCGIIF